MARRRTSSVSKQVFISAPYDEPYEPQFLALIAGLAGLGLIPRAVLEIPGSQRRLDRILRLIAACPYSVHDLSRVELDKRRPPTPRFNMPFELGLAVAWAQHRNKSHKWFVLESRRYRVNKSLSDLDGTQVYIHGAKPKGTLRALTNAFARPGRQPSVQELFAVYLDLRNDARDIKRKQAAQDLYDTRPFLDLVLAASAIASRRIPT